MRFWNLYFGILNNKYILHIFIKNERILSIYMECNFKKKIELLIPGSWQRATNMVFSASSENFIQNAIEGNRGHLIGTLPDRQFIRVPPRPINEINLIHCTQHREEIISHIYLSLVLLLTLGNFSSSLWFYDDEKDQSYWFVYR